MLSNEAGLSRLCFRKSHRDLKLRRVISKGLALLYGSSSRFLPSLRVFNFDRSADDIQDHDILKDSYKLSIAEYVSTS